MRCMKSDGMNGTSKGHHEARMSFKLQSNQCTSELGICKIFLLLLNFIEDSFDSILSYN